METSRRVMSALPALLLAGQAAVAGPCDAYFSFDGNLADGSGSGHDGRMVTEGGVPTTPRFTEGKSGNALDLDGTSAMRAEMDLHPDNCPQLTITAWIKVAPDAREGHIIASEGEQGPGLKYFSRSLWMLGPSYGVTQRDAIFPGSWVFVALVYDRENDVQRLHWGGRSVEKKMDEDRLFPGAALWVGANGMAAGGQRLASSLNGTAIDELRIFGAALDDERIAAVRDAARGTTNSVASAISDDATSIQKNPQPAGALSDAEQAAVEAAVGDMRAPALEYESDEAAIIAKLERDLAAERQRVSDLEAELEALRSGSGGSGAGGSSATLGGASSGYTLAGTSTLSELGGYSGESTSPIEFEIEPMKSIGVWRSDIYIAGSFKPVDVHVISQSGKEKAAIGYEHDIIRQFSVGKNGYMLGALDVCTNPVNKRVKGLVSHGNIINPDGSLGLYAKDEAGVNGCGVWHETIRCPLDALATGVVAHFRPSNVGFTRDKLTGFQLICRRIERNQ